MSDDNDSRDTSDHFNEHLDAIKDIAQATRDTGTSVTGMWQSRPYAWGGVVPDTEKISKSIDDLKASMHRMSSEISSLWDARGLTTFMSTGDTSAFNIPRPIPSRQRTNRLSKSHIIRNK